jgi:hypothetical protein
MMYLIHIDEFTIHVSITAWPSCLCVPFSKKLDSLLDRLYNWCMMHDFQCGVHEGACRDQNDAHYYSTAMLHGYKYLLHLALIIISHSFTFFLRVFHSPSSLSYNGK